MDDALLPVAIGAFALAGVIAYGVLAGADFGGGIWDLLASGPRKHEQRDAIAHAIGPVWEANHVWLIFVIVMLFSGFPSAFAALSIGLFAPLHLALVGITLRGAAFVFRAYGPGGPVRARWGAVFGAASAITPVLFGMSLGAVSAGDLRWTSPFAIATGALAIAICAYVAAVFLTNETFGVLREDFRRRALAAGTVVVGLSAVTVPLAAVAAPRLFDGLLSARAVGVVALGVVAALAAGAALVRRRYRLARVAVVAQITTLLLGWGLAQYPFIVYPTFTIHGSAAPPPTLAFVAVAVLAGLVVLLPSLALLFRVFKSTRTAADDRDAHGD